MFRKNRKIEGIILRRMPYREADLILTVLTSEAGLTDCLAAGARRFRSRFLGRLEPLTQVRMEVFEGRNLHRVNEAEALRAPDGFGGHLPSRGAAFFLAEITQKLLQPNQHVKGAYPLLCQTLRALPGSPRAEAMLIAYPIKLLTLLGFMPSWRNCADCGEALRLEVPVRLNAEGSAPHCAACLPQGTPARPVLIRLVRFCQKQPVDDLPELDLSAHRALVWQWMEGLIETLLGRGVKSGAFARAAISDTPLCGPRRPEPKTSSGHLSVF